MKRILTTLLLAAGALAASFLTTTVEANTTRYTAPSGHQYQGIEINRTPSGAQTACVNLGAHLVTFSDYNEYTEVRGNVASQVPNTNFWAGASLPAYSYDKVNVTGEPYYHVSAFYNPEISGGNFSIPYYLTVANGYVQALGWHASSSKYYICEWD